MNRSKLLLTLPAAFCLSVGSVLAAQDLLVIDASTQFSSPVRGRGPFPGSASAGHSNNLPVRLALSVPTTELRPDRRLLVDFVITNVGTEAIRLPSSVNQNIEQRTSVLTLWLTSDAIEDEYFRDTASGRPVKIEMVGTSAELYGSDDPRTFIVLAPNKSMRVHASSRIRLQPGRHTFTAHAELIHLIVRNSSISSNVAGTADSEAVTTTLSTP